MNKKLFGKLVESMRQMDEIARGKRAASCEFRVERERVQDQSNDRVERQLILCPSQFPDSRPARASPAQWPARRCIIKMQVMRLEPNDLCV